MSEDRRIRYAEDALRSAERADNPVLKRVLLGIAGSWLELTERLQSKQRERAAEKKQKDGGG